MIGDFFANYNIWQILLVAIGYLMPIPLSMIALKLWHHYRQERFVMGIKWVLLEIQVPRDVIKSPAAMELFFSNALYHKGGKDFWGKYIQGAPALWFSLEIVSIDGRVHFFIRSPTRIRDLVETQIYSQYPQAKIVEVDDYALHVPQYNKNSGWYMWGCEYTKKKEDFLPIRTYRDITEMDSGTKEEFKIDPITPMIEFLGSLKKGQQMWIQIIVRPNTKKYRSLKTGKDIDFYKATEEYISQILAPYTSIRKNEVGDSMMGILTPDTLKNKVKVMIENANKIHFDCGIRVITLGDKSLTSEEEFNNMRRASRLIWHQYSQPSVNELARVNSTGVAHRWADPTGLVTNNYKKRTLDFYRTRTFFSPPLQNSFKSSGLMKIFLPSGSPQVFIMSSEELATIFHFPGMVSETPSFKRIESKIAKPPSNLPM